MSFRDTWNDIPRRTENVLRNVKSDTRWLHKLDKPKQSTTQGKETHKKVESNNLSLSEIEKRLDGLKEWEPEGRPPERLSLQGEKGLGRLAPQEINLFKNPDKETIEDVKELRHRLLSELNEKKWAIHSNKRLNELKSSIRDLNSLLKVRYMEAERKMLVEQVETITKKYQEANDLIKLLLENKSLASEQILKKLQDIANKFASKINKRVDRIYEINDIFQGKYRIGTERGLKRDFLKRFNAHWTNIFNKYYNKNNTNKPILNEIQVDIQTPEQLIEALHQKAIDFVKNSKVWTYCPHSAVDSILSSGCFKSTFEPGLQKHKDYMKKRAESERKYFNCPKDMNPAKRPIYAFLGNNDNPKGIAAIYGNVAFRFKDTVKKDRLITIAEGDTFRNDNVNRVSYDKPDATMFQLEDHNPLSWKHYPGSQNDHALIEAEKKNILIEAHIHRKEKAVTLDDVDAVYFTNHLMHPTKTQMKIFKNRNIDVFIQSSETGPYQRIEETDYKDYNKNELTNKENRELGTFSELKEAKIPDEQLLKQVEQYLSEWEKLKASPDQYQRWLNERSQLAIPFKKELEQNEQMREKLKERYKQEGASDDVWKDFFQIKKNKEAIKEKIAELTLSPEDKLFVYTNVVKEVYSRTEDSALLNKAEDLFNKLQESLPEDYNPYYSSELHSHEDKSIDSNLDSSCSIYCIRWILRESGIDIENKEAGATEDSVAKIAGLQETGSDAGAHALFMRGGIARVYKNYGLNAEKGGIQSFEDIEHFLGKDKFIHAHLQRGIIGGHNIIIARVFRENDNKFAITIDPMHPDQTRKVNYKEIECHLLYDECIKVSFDKNE